MNFQSFSDFLNHIATGPGFVVNWIIKFFFLITYHLPVFLYNTAEFLIRFVWHLPVFLYKCVLWLFTTAEYGLYLIYDYIFVREWGWYDLGVFPEIRPSEFAVAMRGGIDDPFNRFAGDISIAIKEAVEPLTEAMAFISQQFMQIPWPFLFAGIIGLVWITSKNRGVVMIAVTGLLYLGLLDLMKPASETIALMVVSIMLCVAIGVPIGILMAFSNAIERMVKPVLDVMQTMPSFVYLIPVLILFGVSETAGLIAVFVYAIPPVIRLTNLGIRLVSFDVIEASNAFGATYLQRLRGVLLPLALPNIFAGINQTIMMALAMVVIASLVGAEGLGLVVLQAQSNTLFGLGLKGGFGIVLIAIVIDRTFYCVGERMQEHRTVGH